MRLMNEINPNSNINPYGAAFHGVSHGAAPASKRAEDASSPELFARGSTLSDRDIGPLVKMLASKMQVSELVAFRFLRKLLGTGQAGTFSDLKEFLSQYLQDGSPTEAKRNELFNQLRTRSSEAVNDKQLEAAFKPVLKDFGDKFEQARAQNIRENQSALFNAKSEYVPAQPRMPLTQLVSSPKEFASWLVNNKSAFIAMRANPEVTNLLLALRNPQIQQSPVLVAEITKLLAQLIRLKQGGKVAQVDDSEKLDEERDQEFNIAAGDQEHTIVGGIRETIESVAVTPLRDFLIEAERFAEEEVANLWSLTLKKEKELEKQVKAGLKKFKKPR